MAGRRPLLNRCARPAPPTPPTHSPWRVDAPPDSERLAPAAALTLHRTPRACTGRFLWSSWVQMAYLDARCRCPPLPSRQLQRGASAHCWWLPQVPALFCFDPARTAELLGHPEHPWDWEPPSISALSVSVRPERANCHMCRLYKELHSKIQGWVVHRVSKTRGPKCT